MDKKKNKFRDLINSLKEAIYIYNEYSFIERFIMRSY